MGAEARDEEDDVEEQIDLPMLLSSLGRSVSSALVSSSSMDDVDDMDDDDELSRVRINFTCLGGESVGEVGGEWACTRGLTSLTGEVSVVGLGCTTWFMSPPLELFTLSVFGGEWL